MKRNFTYLFLLFAAAFVISCSKGDDSATLVGASPVSSEVLDPLLIDAAKTELNDTDAAQVMKLFLCRENPDPMTRASFVDKTVDETFPITGDNGETLAYVVNYAGGGYGIVSATKKYAPILAFSDEGRLSAQSLDGNGIALWVASITADIAETKATLAEDSPEYADTRLQWREYEQPEPVSAAASTMQDANYWYFLLRSEMMGTIGYCTRYRDGFFNKAFEYGQWYGNSDLMEWEFQEMDRVLKINYGQWDAPPCMVWGDGLISTSETKIMPLLKTYWAQGYPYNNLLGMKVSNPKEHVNAGCIPVAVSQILNYYKYPAVVNGTPIDWTLTQKKFAAAADIEIQRLIAASHDGVRAVGDLSGSNENKAEDFLKDCGYDVNQYATDIDAFCTTEVQARRPVFICGYNSAGEGHAWVCDGYYAKIDNYQMQAHQLMNRDKQHFAENPYYKFLDKTKSNEWGRFYHMNWGGENGSYMDESDPSSLHGNTDGWFRSVLNTSYKDDMGNEKLGYNFDMKILVIRR